MQVAAGKAKKITSLFEAVTVPLLAYQGWRRTGPGWAAPAAFLGLCYTARGGYEVATVQKMQIHKNVVQKNQAITYPADSEL